MDIVTNLLCEFLRDMKDPVVPYTRRDYLEGIKKRGDRYPDTLFADQSNFKRNNNRILEITKDGACVYVEHINLIDDHTYNDYSKLNLQQVLKVSPKSQLCKENTAKACSPKRVAPISTTKVASTIPFKTEMTKSTLSIDFERFKHSGIGRKPTPAHLMQLQKRKRRTLHQLACAERQKDSYREEIFGNDEHFLGESECFTVAVTQTAKLLMATRKMRLRSIGDRCPLGRGDLLSATRTEGTYKVIDVCQQIKKILDFQETVSQPSKKKRKKTRHWIRHHSITLPGNDTGKVVYTCEFRGKSKQAFLKRKSFISSDGCFGCIGDTYYYKSKFLAYRACAINCLIRVSAMAVKQGMIPWYLKFLPNEHFQVPGRDFAVLHIKTMGDINSYQLFGILFFHGEGQRVLSIPSDCENPDDCRWQSHCFEE